MTLARFAETNKTEANHYKNVFRRWPRLGWVSVGLALVITSLHLLNMTLLLPDLTQVIDEILQVFLRAMRGFCFICVFFLLVEELLSLSLSLIC